MLVTNISSYFDNKIEKVLGLTTAKVKGQTNQSEFLHEQAISKLKNIANNLSDDGVDAIIGVQFVAYCAPEMPNTTYLIATGTAIKIKGEHQLLCLP
jgi:uncharacterized protein YbjQ (UPF0145 family)